MGGTRLLLARAGTAGARRGPGRAGQRGRVGCIFSQPSGELAHRSWASPQSQVIPSREWLENRCRESGKRLRGWSDPATVQLGRIPARSRDDRILARAAQPAARSSALHPARAIGMAYRKARALTCYSPPGAKSCPTQFLDATSATSPQGLYLAPRLNHERPMIRRTPNRRPHLSDRSRRHLNGATRRRPSNRRGRSRRSTACSCKTSSSTPIPSSTWSKSCLKRSRLYSTPRWTGVTATGRPALAGRRTWAGADIVEYLLDHGARIDIFCAAMMGQLDAVKSFLDPRAQTYRCQGPAWVHPSLPRPGRRQGSRARAGVSSIDQKARAQARALPQAAI